MVVGVVAWAEEGRVVLEHRGAAAVEDLGVVTRRRVSGVPGESTDVLGEDLPEEPLGDVGEDLAEPPERRAVSRGRGRCRGGVLVAEEGAVEE